MINPDLKKTILDIFIYPILAKKRQLFFFTMSLLLLACAQSLFLLILGPFLKTIFFLENDTSTISLAYFFSAKIQALVPFLERISFPKNNLVFIVPITILIAAILKNFATYIYQINSAFFGLLVAKEFRNQLFTAILKQPYRDISRHSPAEWMSSLMNDVLYLQNKFSDIVNSLLRDSIMVIGAFLTLFFVHWPTALGLLFVTPFVTFIIGKIGKRIAFYTEAFQRKLASIADLVLEFRRRFEIIKVHRAENYEQARFQVFNNEYYNIIRKSIFIRSIFAPGLEFFSFASLAVIIMLIANGKMNAHFSASEMVIFLATLGMMMRPLRQVGEQLTQLHETQGALGKSLNLLKNLQASSAQENTKKVNTTSFHSQISTGFSMQSGFDNIATIEVKNLNIAPGKTIAIVGPSGGGKSTLIRTLAGLLHPLRWEGNLSSAEIAAQSSFVSQTPFLFDDTLLENLNYGLDTKLNASDLESYFRLVKIEKELVGFQEGLNTKIHAIGNNISGGQKQRLVLLRALLREKSILLLDEATSSVDPKMEEEILDGLLLWVHSQSTAYAKSIIAVTHRLKILSKFDEIWFVENGQVTGTGRLEELMNQKRFQVFYNAAR